MLSLHQLHSTYYPRRQLTVQCLIPEGEDDLHLWEGDCPCVPNIYQIFCTCGRDHGGYRWRAVHRKLKT